MPQFIYRWITPDGATKYSELPPSEAECPASNEFEKIPLQSDLSRGKWRANTCGRLYTAEQAALRSQYLAHLVSQAKAQALQDELMAQDEVKKATQAHQRAYQYYREVETYTQDVYQRYHTAASQAHSQLQKIDQWQDVIDLSTLTVGLATLPFSGTAAVGVGVSSYAIGTANSVARNAGRYDAVSGTRDVSSAASGAALLLPSGVRASVRVAGEGVGAVETLDGVYEVINGPALDDESVVPLSGYIPHSAENLETLRQSLLNQADKVDARAEQASYLEDMVGVDLRSVSQSARDAAKAIEQLQGAAKALAEAEEALTQAIKNHIEKEGGWLFIDLNLERMKELNAKVDAAGLQAWKDHAEKP